MPPSLILASGSRYRAELLGRLGLAFEAQPADVDESPRPGETPAAMAARLAAAKAEAVAARLEAPALVIASDQTASVEGRLLRKPGDAATAVAQLEGCVGREVVFQTALCLREHPGERRWEHLEPFVVRFRDDLERAQLERYVAADQPLDCAGAFKVEALGITLFSALEGADPNALIGLPLIALVRGLKRFGIQLP